MKSSTSSWSDGYGFYYEAGQLKFFAGHYLATVASAAFNPSSAFRHVVGIFEGFDSIRIYVDGALQQSVAQGGTLGSLGSGNLYIGNGAGAGNAPGSFFWDGKLDEVAVYSYVLSDEQIANHYLASFAVPEPSIVMLGVVGGAFCFHKRHSGRRRDQASCSPSW